MFTTCLRILLLLALATSARAGSLQNTQVMYQQVEAWLEQQAALAWPGVEAHARSGNVDDRLRLAACRELQFALPAGSRLGTSGSLSIRCLAGARWSLYVSYRMQLSGPALVSRRALPGRALLGADDVELRVVEYSGSPTDYLKEAPLPAGTFITRPVGEGQALHASWLARHPVVNAGQRVRLVVAGAGFSVGADGQALNAAEAGAMVRVKMTSGRIVSGVAQEDGSVRVQP